MSNQLAKLPVFSVLVFLVSIALVFTGCGKEAPEVLQLGEFESYVKDFEQEAAVLGRNVQVTNLVVAYGDLPQSYYRASCKLTPGETPVITVNQESWDSLSEIDRRAVMFHELGHCILNRRHKNDYSEEGVPLSLMNAAVIDSNIYTENEHYYHEELFLSE